MISFFQGLMAFLLILTSAFMILLILIQRGRGGGISGALGGAGGQSAFGSKAGDVFTRITIGTAVVWIVLTIMTISIFNPPRPNVIDTAKGSIRGTGEQTQPSSETPGTQPGVTDQDAGQLPGETSEDVGKVESNDPNLNPPAQETPANPPATNEGGETVPADGSKSGESGGEKKDPPGSGGQ